MSANSSTDAKNQLAEFLVEQIQLNKTGHLIIEDPDELALNELNSRGFLNNLTIEGKIINVAYNSTLLHFVNQGGFK